MFTTAQMHTNTHGSIEASDLIEEANSGYHGRETIKEETDLSIMDDRHKQMLVDKLPEANGRNRHNRYLSMEKDIY